MKRLLLLVILLLPCTSWSAPHSDDWCADAVDFAMRTAMYHGLGEKYVHMSKALDQQAVVFKQQYPSLSTEDMRALIERTFKQGWSHFGAAVAVSRDCRKSDATLPDDSDHLTSEHSDEWCADAVDYGMTTAQNRDFGYTAAMLDKSVSQQVYFYKTMFPELSTDDLLYLNRLVYSSKWSRFDAAHVISSSCRVIESQKSRL